MAAMSNLDHSALTECLHTLRHLFIDVGRLKYEESYEARRGGHCDLQIATLDHNTTGDCKLVAVKNILLRTRSTEPKILAFRLARELKIWSGLRHPHVLPLLGFYLDLDNRTALLISEFMAPGDLKEYIGNVKPGADEQTQSAGPQLGASLALQAGLNVTPEQLAKAQEKVRAAIGLFHNQRDYSSINLSRDQGILLEQSIQQTQSLLQQVAQNLVSLVILAPNDERELNQVAETVVTLSDQALMLQKPPPERRFIFGLSDLNQYRHHMTSFIMRAKAVQSQTMAPQNSQPSAFPPGPPPPLALQPSETMDQSPQPIRPPPSELLRPSIPATPTAPTIPQPPPYADPAASFPSPVTSTAVHQALPADSPMMNTPKSPAAATKVATGKSKPKAPPAKRGTTKQTPKIPAAKPLLTEPHPNEAAKMTLRVTMDQRVLQVALSEHARILRKIEGPNATRTSQLRSSWQSRVAWTSRRGRPRSMNESLMRTRTPQLRPQPFPSRCSRCSTKAPFTTRRLGCSSCRPCRSAQDAPVLALGAKAEEEADDWWWAINFSQTATDDLAVGEPHELVQSVSSQGPTPNSEGEADAYTDSAAPSASVSREAKATAMDILEGHYRCDWKWEGMMEMNGEWAIGYPAA
ncbi:hypothetical protein FRB90_001852 [Tulasnella sp. 427]|nr:hypothetical protein FRB90_001852 [Tulasnella sp. 427]